MYYYQQSGEYSYETSSAIQLKRNQTTRSLWDPNYVDPSWVGDKVRLKQWVNTYYPGTKIGITEYNFGAEGHINGATTLADVWGIFGREGLDLANYWTVPNTGTPVYNAMKLYRNYDGLKSTFGDTSVAATVPNPNQVAAFAAQRSSDGALTVVVINKTTSATGVNVSLANYAVTGAAQAWQLTSTNKITRLTDVALSGNVLSTSLPAQSITLFVVPGSGGTSTAPTVGTAAVAVSPSTVSSGSTTQGSVTLTAPAPAGGAVVSLSVDQTAVSVSASVTVPAGASSTTFNVTTGNVVATTNVTVTAACNNSAKSTVLTVQPATSTATPTFSATASASPSSVSRRQNTTISTTVTCSAGSLTNGVVDVEIFNSSGSRVKQVTWSAQNFISGQSRPYNFTWSTSTRGTYTVKVGVFTQNSASQLYWNAGAATLTVN